MEQPLCLFTINLATILYPEDRMLHNISLNSLNDKFNVSYLLPFGVELSAVKPNTSLNGIETETLKLLLQKYHLLSIRNLNSILEPHLIEFAKSMGPLLAWDFGVVMEMRVHEKPNNYLFTCGQVPFHWDGAFHKEPKFLLFHCVKAPLAHCGGETLFTNTNQLWQRATIEERRKWLTIKLKYKTEKLAHYGGEINVPFVQKHPDTKQIILRFAEPVPQTMLNPVEILIEGIDEEKIDHWVADMTARCYHHENCYKHQWMNNDILLTDNYYLIHARKAFKQFSPRFLRRIQIL